MRAREGAEQEASLVSQRFVRALTTRDRDGMLAVLAPEVRMRAMAPGRTWRSNDAREVVDDVLLRDFFGPDVAIEKVTWLQFRDIADQNSAGYHLWLRRGEERMDCEQHIFFDIEGGLIYALMLSCSGFIRVHEQR